MHLVRKFRKGVNLPETLPAELCRDAIPRTNLTRENSIISSNDGDRGISSYIDSNDGLSPETVIKTRNSCNILNGIQVNEFKENVKKVESSRAEMNSLLARIEQYDFDNKELQTKIENAKIEESVIAQQRLEHEVTLKEQSELYIKNNDKLSELKSNIIGLQHELDERKETINQKLRDKEALCSEITKLNRKHELLIKQTEDSERTNQMFENQVEQLREQIQQQIEINENQSIIIKNCREKIEQHKMQKLTLASKLEKQQQDFQNLVKESENLKNQNTNNANELKALKNAQKDFDSAKNIGPGTSADDLLIVTNELDLSIDIDHDISEIDNLFNEDNEKLDSEALFASALKGFEDNVDEDLD